MRVHDDALRVACPRCTAPAGVACLSMTGVVGRPSKTHRARLDAAPPSDPADAVEPRGCPCGGGDLHYLCRRAPVRS